MKKLLPFILAGFLSTGAIESLAISNQDNPNLIETPTDPPSNSMGLVVYTQNVHGERGQNIIDLQKLPVGVYILTTKCEEHSITNKLVVTR